MIKTIFRELMRGLVSAFALCANLLRCVYMFTVSALTESTSSISIFTACRAVPLAQLFSIS